MHLPLDYERVAVGAIADKASIFKSALQALPVVTAYGNRIGSDAIASLRLASWLAWFSPEYHPSAHCG